MSDLYYLASPYSNPDKTVVNQRFEEACKAAAYLMLKGYKIFAPIPHSHPIEQVGMNGELKDHTFWLDQDFAILEKCDGMIIAMIPGWDQSYGVSQEIKYCILNNKPILFYDTETKEIFKDLDA